MKNFMWHIPTKFVFGRGAQLEAGRLCAAYGKKVLIHYGGGSAERSGLLGLIRQTLEDEGLSYVELGGAAPNPRLSLVYEGIELARRERVDVVLAVGGGSAMDSAKAIALGMPYNGDVWDFYCAKAVPCAITPMGVVVTLPASGSESSNSSVITNDDGMYKRGVNTELQRPLFAMLNPELTYTLPAYQTACGAVDMMAHIMERYFTNEPDVELTDRLCEAALQTIIHNAPVAIARPDDYASRAELMWAGNIAHNDTLGVGRVGDWASHKIEHELSALYDVAHGAGLAVIFPAWMRYVYRHDLERFRRFAVHVWGCPDTGASGELALMGIRRTVDFFRSIGMPVSLRELGAREADIPAMAKKVARNPDNTVGQFVKLDTPQIEEIYRLAL